MSKNIIIAITSIVLLILVLNPIFFAGDLGSYASKQDKQISSMGEAQFSKQYFAHVQAHDFDTVKASLDPKIVDAQFKEKFDDVANVFPNEVPKSIKFIGANTNTFNGISKTNLSSEYEFSNKWILTGVVLQKQGNGFLVLGFGAQPIIGPLEKLSQFSFLGKSVKHYAVFGIAISLLLFDVYVLALCIKTHIPKRKWLWIIFILIGFGCLKFNWMNGEFDFFKNFGNGGFTGANIDFIKFPVVQFSQMLYEPFFITMTIPLGAIIFLLKRKKWLVHV